MKKAGSQEAEAVRSLEWVAVETQGIAAKISEVKPLEVHVGSCVVSVPAGFDKGLFIEVCQTLLRL